MDASSPVLKEIATVSETPRVAPKRKAWKGAEILIEYLIKEKVPYLFGVCGHGNIGFLDAAAEAAARIKTISVHHEQAAGYMADAYYKIRHEPVATYTSCGPGSCNLPVALAGAMMDSSAFLAITGNVPTTHASGNAAAGDQAGVRSVAHRPTGTGEHRRAAQRFPGNGRSRDSRS
jgi:glyoxylate carboligase